ncbi:hypothetical protein [Paracoccus spongiarum]|uniref:Uncharacterized protein n=1 Tax=Paracoccus spongiarum TaxID=3064387 RepID=A0ABT9JDU0_9RHOB|nr:hypothetical protein [Paracoccus sp. 2205BS29-5]MDP5307983.1 hypothetical protein [Paracoccus sp. 2205BS29-5]
MLGNDTSLSKIGKIVEISYRDLPGKIDCFRDLVRAFPAERQDFSSLDFAESGSRFATDSQTLIMNWPTRRDRTSVAVQHLFIAQAPLGLHHGRNPPVRFLEDHGRGRGKGRGGQRGSSLGRFPHAWPPAAAPIRWPSCGRSSHDQRLANPNC